VGGCSEAAAGGVVAHGVPGAAICHPPGVAGNGNPDGCFDGLSGRGDVRLRNGKEAFCTVEFVHGFVLL